VRVNGWRGEKAYLILRLFNILQAGGMHGAEDYGREGYALK